MTSNKETDAYLHLASRRKIPISVYFLDGEVVPLALIKQVGIFTLLLTVPAAGEVLVYKNALKKIAAAGPAVEPGGAQ